MPKLDRNKLAKQYLQTTLFEEPKMPVESVSDEKRDDLLQTLLALASVKGIGFVTLGHMYDSGFPDDFWEMDSSELLQRWNALPGRQRPDLAESIINDRAAIRTAGQEAAAALRRQLIVFAPLGHQYYPRSLLRLEQPPRWFFARGNLDAMQQEGIVGVVGTRKASREGLRLAYRFAKELITRNVVVLSGLAQGIDEQAHRGAVDHFGQTIAILGHGINANRSAATDELSEKIIERGGVIISEYLPYEHPSRERYLRRNELQAALSRVIVPVECPSLNSGTGATIRRAMKIGTDLAGIVPAETTEQSLQATNENLRLLNIPVFQVMNGDGSNKLWAYLTERIPQHDWSADPRPRQERFFRVVEAQLQQVRDSLRIDEEAVQHLAAWLIASLEDKS